MVRVLSTVFADVDEDRVRIDRIMFAVEVDSGDIDGVRRRGEFGQGDHDL